MDGVSTQLDKIGRDKAKHHQFKTSPAYNSRQKAIRVEKKKRTAADPKKKLQAAEDEDKENVDPRTGSLKRGKRQKTVIGLKEDCGRTML